MMPPLYYVIGASGVGKDSLLNYVRQHLAGKQRVLFAHRYVTRPAEPDGENHVVLSRAEFDLRRELGLFCMHWESHGLCYGLGVELLTWMRNGCAVVMNGSRAYLEHACRQFPQIAPVLVTADPAVLRQRLQDRGRESVAQVEERLSRAGKFEVVHPHLYVVENNGSLEDAGKKLLDKITADLEKLH